MPRSASCYICMSRVSVSLLCARARVVCTLRRSLEMVDQIILVMSCACGRPKALHAPIPAAKSSHRKPLLNQSDPRCRHSGVLAPRFERRAISVRQPQRQSARHMPEDTRQPRDASNRPRLLFKPGAAAARPSLQPPSSRPRAAPPTRRRCVSSTRTWWC